jgi:LacI family transcriptional regulator
VSRALNAAKRDLVNAKTVVRIVRAAESLGYQPNPIARSLKTAKTNTIGVILPDLTNPLFPPIVRGIEDVLQPAGYTSLIVNTDNDPGREESLVQSLRSRQVDGFIIATALMDHPLLDELHRQGVPLVMVNRRPHHLNVSCVSPDDAHGAELAVRHLASLGHRRIAQLAGPSNTSTGLARSAAFHSTMKTLGIEDPPQLTYTCDYWTEESGAQGLRSLLDSGVEFTAVVAGNDLIALGCYDVLAERRLSCPDDLSVVGFNDMPFVDKVRPALTTIAIPSAQIGAEAARVLIETIDDPTRTPRSVWLPSSLVIRSSTMAPVVRDSLVTATA